MNIEMTTLDACSVITALYEDARRNVLEVKEDMDKNKRLSTFLFRMEICLQCALNQTRIARAIQEQLEKEEEEE